MLMTALPLIVRSLLAGVPVDAQVLREVHAALAAKDASELAILTRSFPVASREGLLALLQLYGDETVLIEAEKALKRTPAVRDVLLNLKWIAERISGTPVTFDLADLRGYAYYSGVRFAVYAKNASDALVRGGRYDEVGAVFGRNRPAAGFSLDLKQLVGAVPARVFKASIRAPWVETAEARAAIAALRASGETVVCSLPGRVSEEDESLCDRELVYANGCWIVQAV